MCGEVSVERFLCGEHLVAELTRIALRPSAECGSVCVLRQVYRRWFDVRVDLPRHAATLGHCKPGGLTGRNYGDCGAEVESGDGLSRDTRPVGGCGGWRRCLVGCRRHRDAAGSQDVGDSAALLVLRSAHSQRDATGQVGHLGWSYAAIFHQHAVRALRPTSFAGFALCRRRSGTLRC